MDAVHIVYEGQTQDLGLEDLIPMEDRASLGIEDDTELHSNDLNADQIKRALANHYDKPVDEFNELIVEFHKSGDITVRPNATFGT